MKHLFMQSKIKTLIIVLIIAALITLPLVSAVYLATSNHITGSPAAQQTIILAVNSTTPVVGDTLHLTAHWSDNSAGQSLTLSNAGSDAVSNAAKNTDNAGQASWDVKVNNAYDFSVQGAHL